MTSVRLRSTARGVALACALMLAAACQPGTDTEQAGDVTDASPTAEADDQDDAPDDEQDDPDAEGDPDGDEAPPAAGTEVREPLTLDVQQTHANGTVVRILGARFPSNAVELEVEILNGYGSQVWLTSSVNPMVLADDTGDDYPLSLPAGTSDVDVEAGERLMGTLTFLGRINPAATELTLHTYGGYDGEPGEQYRHLPSVNMSIPIPLEQN